MDINQCYRLLRVESSASNDDISKSFKALAMKYHPDKNPERKEWANEQMTILSTAYSTLMGYRFSQSTPEVAEPVGKQDNLNHKRQEQHTPSPVDDLNGLREEAKREYLINRFIKCREDAKDAMYRYFQFGLYNFHRREDISNRRIYNNMVISLRKSFHTINKMSALTNDRELLEHF